MRKWGTTILVAAGSFGAGAFLFLAVAAPSPPQQQAEYVGADLCAECHVDQSEKFDGTIHDSVLAYVADDTAASGCETCHGPGSLHAEMAGSEDPGWREAINGSPGAATCFDCHADVRGQFSLTESHPVLEGFMTCADCHDPHGSTERSFLAAAQNDTCTACHTDKAGPFIFPHPVVETEGCVACHTPHGSTVPHMLPFREITFTCMGCHDFQPTFHSQPGFAECDACHTQIHGSNLDRYFLE